MSQPNVLSEATELHPAQRRPSTRKLVTISLATITESSRTKDITLPDTVGLLDSSMQRNTLAAPSEESNLHPATSSTNLPYYRAYTTNAPTPHLDMDKILGSGKFQWIIVAFTHLSCALIVMHHMSMQTFFQPVGQWCRPPADIDVDADQWKETNIPLRPDGTYSQCTVYQPESLNTNTTRVEVACSEWQYDLQPGDTTVVSEWNLVCDRAWYVPVAFVYNRVGVVISVLFFGQILDKVGRLPAVYTSTIVSVASAAGTVLARTFINFIAARILLAAALSVLNLALLVILFENSGEKHRESNICLALTGTVVASVLARVFALAPKNYKTLDVVNFSLTLALAPLFCSLDESISWLLVSNNVEFAEKVARRAASWNSRQLNEESLFITMTTSHTAALLPQMNFLTFLTSEKLWKRTATLCWTWFSLLLSLYGMELRGRSDSRWHVVFLGVTRTSIILVSLKLLLASRRKDLLSLALPLTCCMLLLYGTIKDMYEGTVTWIIGEAIVCMLMGEMVVVTIFTLELYPTVVRGIGTFVASFFGQLGATFGPILLQPQAHVSPAAASVLCVVMLSAVALLIRLLPETKNQKTPQTMQDIIP